MRGIIPLKSWRDIMAAARIMGLEDQVRADLTDMRFLRQAMGEAA